ncbi:hypothetical protein ASD79_05930 [Caulobacter sp. Root655]|uniref:hypothetical protein n=1 Tax=Caulobacter sp. Root655 TaxID=1736578 RepID=UPI0006F54FB4|nr:hypothetical protein [Caulobacter sp. Root655]KRA61651.1 hypothetical protein ASD79_05930 [Caulobacter sp. Root655]
MKYPVLWAASALVAVTAISGFATARQERSAPGVSLARDVVAAASAFETYTRGAGTISAAFKNGGGVAQALATGAAYQADQLDAGMVAYGAIAALQETAFIDGVRQAARNTPPDVLIARLTENPESVIEIDGVGAAASRAQAALLQRATPLGVTGRAVKQSAYDIQHQDWSKDPIADSAGRLARVKAMSAALFVPGDEDGGRLILSATAPRDDNGSPGFGGSAEGGAAFTPVTVRAAALAALAVLGAAGDDDVARLDTVMHEKKSGFCMKMAKLNLYQCLAVAGPHYEDVFCLGQHALIDTAQCVTDAAGGARVPTASPMMTAAPRRAPGLFIPVGGTGPEVAAMSPVPGN